jgi:hypothetical protein
METTGSSWFEYEPWGREEEAQKKAELSAIIAAIPRPKEKVLYKPKVNYDSVPPEATRFEWKTKGNHLEGLYLGVAADPTYPGNYLGIMHDFTCGLVYFSMPLKLRKVLYNKNRHIELDITYDGLVGRQKQFRVITTPIT